MKCTILFLILSLLTARATPFYIDPGLGSDAANGTSASTPWQHCPGDSAATGNAAGHTSVAGDTFYFILTNSANYSGSVVVNGSGTVPATITAANITSNGVVTSAGTNFASVGINTATDWANLVNTDPAGGAHLVSGIWRIAATNATSLTLNSFDRSNYVYSGCAAMSGNLLTVEIWRPILFTTTNTFGSGEGGFTGGQTNHLAVRISSGLIFQNIVARDYSNEAPCVTINEGAFYDNGGNVSGGSNSHIALINCYVSNAFSGLRCDTLDHAVLISNKTDTTYFVGLEGGSYSTAVGNILTNGTSSLRGFGAFSVIMGNVIMNSNRSASNACGFHADGIGPLFSPGVCPACNTNGWMEANFVANTVEYEFLEYNNNGTANWTLVNNVNIGENGYNGGSGDSGMLIRSAPGTKIYNNTFFGLNASTGFGDTIQIQTETGYPGCSNVVEHGNVIYCLGSLSSAQVAQDTASTNGLVSDGNVYFIPNRSTPFKANGGNISYASWQALGFDASTSTNGIDPIFVQAAGVNPLALDLHLVRTSPLAPPGSYSLPVDTVDPLGILIPAGTLRMPGAYVNPINVANLCCHN